MAKQIHRLSARAVETVNTDGLRADGGGLYIAVSKSGAKSWRYIFQFAGKRKEMGLGKYPAVSLQNARIKAQDAREMVSTGCNPIAERKRQLVQDQARQTTFKSFIDEWLPEIQSEFQNAKHSKQWDMTLNHYAKPLHALPIEGITTDHVLGVLRLIWAEKPETASRLRGRIERALDAAKARGFRSGENPAAWRGHLQTLLPKPKKLSRGHQPSMPYEDIPEFMTRLRKLGSVSALGLEWLILSGSRSNEVMGAVWSEIDEATGVWTLPANRMKSGREHQVPLVPRHFEILDKVRILKDEGDYLFPGQRRGRPLSGMAFLMLMRRMDVGHYVPHGFRSSFRDWTGDETEFSRDVAEMAIAHKVGNSVEIAYRRRKAIEKRRELLRQWEAYMCSLVERRESEAL